jgi:hypothetical protein
VGGSRDLCGRVPAPELKVSFVFFSVNTRLIWLILLSMGLGAALGSILPRWWRSRNRVDGR